MEGLSILILQREIRCSLPVDESQLRLRNPHQDDRKQDNDEYH